jgi:hypothetical protein
MLCEMIMEVNPWDGFSSTLRAHVDGHFLEVSLATIATHGALPKPVLLTHEKYQGADILFGCPIPIAQQDFINHQAYLAFTKDEVSRRLSHQVLPRQTKEQTDWIDQLAEVRDRVGDCNGAGKFHYKIFAFAADF